MSKNTDGEYQYKFSDMGSNAKPYIPNVLDLVCTGFDENSEPINQLVIDDIQEEFICVTNMISNENDFYPIETIFYKLCSLCQSI